MNHNNEKQKVIYTALNSKKMKKAYKKQIKNAWFVKNITSSNNKKFIFVEKIIKFFITIILYTSTPKLSWKNKSKTNELINRAYNKFTSKDFAFIPVTTAFYFLISFIPIITIVLIMCSLINNYNELFIKIILSKVIPGVKVIMTVPTAKANSAQYTSLIILLLASTLLSSRGFGKFIYTQNYIYGHETLGNFFINRLKGLLVVVAISIYLFLFSSLYIFIYTSFTQNMNELNKNVFFYITFSVYLFLVLYLGFMLLYKFTPSFKLSINMINPGVLITTFPVWLFIGIFGYLTSIIDYNKYGAIGTFMYIAMFVSALSYFVYLGIIANEAYYKTYFSNYTVSKRKWIFNKINL